MVGLGLAGAAEEPVHEVRGVVVGKMEERCWLMVDHEEIPDFMPAMVMAFTVDDALYPVLVPGMALAARMSLGGPSGWRLDEVRVLAEAGGRLVPGVLHEVTLHPRADGRHAGGFTVAVPAPGRWRVGVESGAVWVELLAPDGAALTGEANREGLPAGLRKGVVFDVPRAGEHTVEVAGVRDATTRVWWERMPDATAP
jgi:hypothetical protein